MIDIFLKSGERLDIEGNITFNYQSSDIGDFAGILSNYTLSFKILKTPTTVKIFNFLGAKNWTSRAPYQKIMVDVYWNSILIQENAQLKILSTTKEAYEVTIIKGLINFFDLFKDLKLNELSLFSLNHDKSENNITSSWQLNRPYCYFIADFNGKTLADVSGTTNLDSNYMTPFANVKYLIDKVFENYGWSYSGLPDIENQWMTYGNALNEENAAGAIVGDFKASDILNKIYIWQGGPTQYRVEDITILMGEGLDSNYLINNGTSIEVLTDEILTLTLPRLNREKSTNRADGRFEIYINGVRKGLSFYLGESVVLDNLNQGDLISLKFVWNLGFQSGPGGTYANLYFYDSIILFANNITPINYQEGTFEMKISDFVKDVMVRNGAIAVHDANNENHINFYTIKDRLDFPIEDWTKKYIDVISEEYIYQGYGQENRLTHEYEDEGDSYADGVIKIDNENIPASNEIYKSFSYPADKYGRTYSYSFPPINLTYDVFLFKMFEIEETNTGEIYKPLNSRSYFATKKQLNVQGIYINNNFHLSPPIADSFDMKKVKEEFYMEFEELPNDLKIKKIKLKLNALDLTKKLFEFKYYFKQENKFFLLNSLSVKDNGDAEGEFIELKI